jgi:hypothetical protein
MPRLTDINLLRLDSLAWSPTAVAVSIRQIVCREERAMRIDHTAFGEITIDGKTYEHEVVIRLSGEVAKQLSKRL